MVSDSIEKYIDQVEKILAQIPNTQGENIERAVQICAESILGDDLVHLFGTGHSQILVEEMILRQGIVGTGSDLLAMVLRARSGIEPATIAVQESGEKLIEFGAAFS